MNGCRIGKVTDKKTGNTIQRMPERNMVVHTTDVKFKALIEANRHSFVLNWLKSPN